MTEKSLGQIAWETETEGYGLQWSEISEKGKQHWERIAQAVAEKCAEVCDEHFRLRADGGFPREASAARYLAAAIREMCK